MAEKFRMTESDASLGRAGWGGMGQAMEQQCMAGQGGVGYIFS